MDKVEEKINMRKFSSKHSTEAKYSFTTLGSDSRHYKMNARLRSEESTWFLFFKQLRNIFMP